MADEQYQDYSTGGGSVPTSFSMDNFSPNHLNADNFSPLPELSWGEFLSWVVGQRSRHRIEGRSMQPLLQPGDEILYHPRAYQTQLPQVGDVIIARHPEQATLVMIKRVAAIENQHYWLLGDNRLESTDSRNFGWVNASCLLGKVQCQFSPGSASPPPRQKPGHF